MTTKTPRLRYVIASTERTPSTGAPAGSLPTGVTHAVMLTPSGGVSGVTMCGELVEELHVFVSLGFPRPLRSDECRDCREWVLVDDRRRASAP